MVLVAASFTFPGLSAVISSRVKEDASGKLALETEDLGEPELKNIAAKIRAFRVRLEGGAAAPARPTLALPGKPSG